jgi:glycolate oxidase
MSNPDHYQEVTAEIVSLLKEIVGEQNVITDEARENYARDETLKIKSVLPEVVVKPENTESVSAIMTLANERKIPVTPRGAGTGISGGAVPINRGIVLSLEKMNRIVEIDKDNFTATVEPGVVLTDFYQAIEEQGLYYPLYPGETSATLGGNAATNAGGLRAVKYGVTKNYVLGLEAVLPSGQIVSTGGKFVKCSTGYDLTQLLVGSEGTLAVITGIILKLIPPPGRRELLFIPYHSLKEAIESVPAVLKKGIFPVGIEFMEHDIVSIVEKYTEKEIPLHDYEAYLMMIIEAEDEDGINRIANDIGEVCLEHGAVDIFMPGSEAAKRRLLEFREKFYSSVSHLGVLDVVDVVVPRSRIADFVEKIKEISKRHGVPIIAYGHAGDGNVHLHLEPTGKDDSEQRVKKILTEIYQLGASLGGEVSGEHGLGFAKKDYFKITADKGKIELMRNIKQAFDPNNIMNPGKVIDME